MNRETLLPLRGSVILIVSGRGVGENVGVGVIIGVGIDIGVRVGDCVSVAAGLAGL